MNRITIIILSVIIVCLFMIIWIVGDNQTRKIDRLNSRISDIENLQVGQNGETIKDVIGLQK